MNAPLWVWKLTRLVRTAGKASSFADPADVAAFRKWYRIYINEGYSPDTAEKMAFAKGDNGVGCWGDDTSQGSGISCALAPDDMIERWRSIAGARHKKVRVWVNGHSVVCVLKDRLPWKKFIKHGVVVDLNPDACSAFGLRPPMLVDATWAWID
jgi:hypothetical protein